MLYDNNSIEECGKRGVLLEQIFYTLLEVYYKFINLKLVFIWSELW